MADGTPRHAGASPARHVKRSYEGGRRVSMEAGAGRSRDSGIGDDPMRVAAGESFPGAASDEAVLSNIDYMAECVAKLSPSYQENRRSIAAKLKAAVDELS